MKRYGIIGNPLGHSYSEAYFTEKFSREHILATYKPYELSEIQQVRQLLNDLDGFNVTYPYKESILPFLQQLDPIAQSIGAVNVVSHGIGYNTDWIGFRDSIQPELSHLDTHALLLGTGGVSKAIQYALNNLGIHYTLVSRQQKNNAITYQQIDSSILKQHSIIINCTPLGMSPYQHLKPDLPYHLLEQKHLLYDCIYNPEVTLFLRAGQQQGCRTINGLQMLHLQADYAWQIWNQ